MFWWVTKTLRGLRVMMASISPRAIQMPLSGGDRKHFARELRRVESLHAELVKRVDAAYAAAKDQLRLAHRLECEEWNARLFLGGDEAPSPALADAIDAGATLLKVKCNACRATRRVDLTHVIWPRTYQVLSRAHHST
ncbi:MAG: hypothetical protein BGO16_16635 [Nitrobacter sp. 62-23]|nr:MAG: hypothetical protein BGO16_16635 [Nitrobacter sp. 62-23]